MNRKKDLGGRMNAFLSGENVRKNGRMTAADSRFRELAIDAIRAGRYQPRTRMDEQSLAELAASIREEGVISPILVRKIPEGGYEVLAGERRLRAARMVGLSSVPVLVEDVDDQRALVIGLIENIQRADLNPLEEAGGLQRLIDEFDFTHEAVAKAIGRSRSAISNILRLLELGEEVKRMLLEGELEMGHARALLALHDADQVAAAKTVVARGLSVRQTEELVRRLQGEGVQCKSNEQVRTRDDERLEEMLADALGAVVRLSTNRKGKGKLVIEFSNLDQLQGIVEHIRR